MSIESFFIKEGIKEAQIEDFLSKKFDRAGYSHIEIERTPLGTRIIVFAEKPGLVIGKSGILIKEITDEIRGKFGIENPMLDVKEIEQPLLDAQVVAVRIAKSIERESFYKKVVNYYLNEIMKAGAVGVRIRIAGKLGGERGKKQKFKIGYVKHSGYYADNILDKGYARATVKLGVIGVQVEIMKDMPEDLSQKIADLNQQIKEKIEAREIIIEEKKPTEEVKKEEKPKEEPKVEKEAPKEEIPEKEGKDCQRKEENKA